MGPTMVKSKIKEKRKTRNQLNDLTGGQLLYFTNTLWETNVAPDRTHALRKGHGAIKPPQAMAELVRFLVRRPERRGGGAQRAPHMIA